MSPTEPMPEQVFAILPTTSPVPISPINAQIHKDNHDTVIIITATIGAAIVLSLLALWIFFQRAVLCNMLTTIRRRKSSREDVEAPTPETLEVAPESPRRWCAPNFSLVSPNARVHDITLPPLPELPTTTDDLKKLGREAREIWTDTDGSLDLPRPGGDVALRHVTPCPTNTSPHGRDLTARPNNTAT